MEEVKNTKLIGIGNEGIKKLEEVESKIVEKIDTEKININKDVDKDYVRALLDRKSTRLNSSHTQKSRMPSSA